MRLLIDAQLPVRLASALSGDGHNIVHASQLPDGNRTTDAVLAQVADADGRIVMTKDRDFQVSHLVRGAPRRLLLVTTGNIANDNLISLVTRNVRLIERAFDDADFVELSSTAVITHGRAEDR